MCAAGPCHAHALACASDGQATLSLHKNARVPSAAARLEFDDQVICWNPWHASDGTLQARADFGLLRPAPGWASEADAEQGQTGSNGLQSCSSILHAYPVSPSLYFDQFASAQGALAPAAAAALT